MSKVLILYASMSGNTEAIADLIGEGLTGKGMNITKLEALDADSEVLKTYNRIILGAYTWGDGDLPDEFLDLYDDMREMDLTGKFFAVFGSGDHSYEHFCGAADTLAECIKQQGGILVLDPLKIEFSPDRDEELLCKDFGWQFSEKALALSL
ncbi:flavodoxin [Metabacillus sp. 84]|uniref:flavodoxin n=1 Tax=unclassified Metabacillus TaxID=2675274 RepID=UPI003CECAAD1